MNLSNATLAAIATAVVDASGDAAFPTSTTLSARCVLGDPTYAQRRTLEARIAEATGVCYVRMAWFPAGLVPDAGDRLTIALDGRSAEQFRAVFVRPRVKDGGGGELDHFEIYVAGVRS